MEYIFYSIIGPHCQKSAIEIIKEKQHEIELGICSSNLWSARIDQKSIEQVWNLDASDRVFVLGKINTKATDPGKEKKIITAQKMIGPTGEESIPTGIETTYPEGKNYQAYKVKKYEILDSPISFDLGKYESLLRNNTTQSFKQRFDGFSRFQNTFGKKNNQLSESCIKEISVIMELEYPFVVKII